MFRLLYRRVTKDSTRMERYFCGRNRAPSDCGWIREIVYRDVAKLGQRKHMRVLFRANSSAEAEGVPLINIDSTEGIWTCECPLPSWPGDPGFRTIARLAALVKVGSVARSRRWRSERSVAFQRRDSSSCDIFAKHTSISKWPNAFYVSKL